MEWVFFDVGNVLMDERPWVAWYVERTFEELRKVATDLDRETFDRFHEESLQQTGRLPMSFVTEQIFTSPEVAFAFRQRYWQDAMHQYYALNGVAEGMFAVLDSLKPHYPLGVIANQTHQIHDWMRRTGLVDYFPLAVYDCDLGFGKPDLRLYEYALDKAVCAPENALMIGDRLDNDIRPAKALGMKTLRLRAFGEYIRAEPADDAETPDMSVQTVPEITDAVRRLANA